MSEAERLGKDILALCGRGGKAAPAISIANNSTEFSNSFQGWVRDRDISSRFLLSNVAQCRVAKQDIS
jgi:hypothetical protein